MQGDQHVSVELRSRKFASAVSQLSGYQLSIQVKVKVPWKHGLEIWIQPKQEQEDNTSDLILSNDSQILPTHKFKSC